MKTALCFVLLSCSLGMIVADDCVYSHTAGKPSCTAANFATKYFRNNWDPSRYWVCESEGAIANSKHCDGEWYNPTTQLCDDWINWEWIPPCDPPSASEDDDEDGDCVYSHNDGRPTCTAANVVTKYFRNNWDSTRYWVCGAVGATAASNHCDGKWYNPTTQLCDDWSNWFWTFPCDPPTA